MIPLIQTSPVYKNLMKIDVRNALNSRLSAGERSHIYRVFWDETESPSSPETLRVLEKLRPYLED